MADQKTTNRSKKGLFDPFGYAGDVVDEATDSASDLVDRWEMDPSWIQTVSIILFYGWCQVAKTFRQAKIERTSYQRFGDNVLLL